MSQARCRVLSLAICACCHEVGFATAEESVIDILSVMLQSIITEAGKGSQMLAEHDGRCEVTPNDVFLTLIEMGLNIESIIEYGKKKNFIKFPAPTREQPTKRPPILQAGQTRALHSYIPSYFPPFPDPHSYIRTPTHKQPISEYEAIRDKAASQKRDLERALTRFVAKTCNLNEAGKPNHEHSLFAHNENLNKYFPLITIQRSPLPFLNALIPKDQIFDDEEEEEETSND